MEIESTRQAVDTRAQCAPQDSQSSLEQQQQQQGKLEAAQLASCVASVAATGTQAGANGTQKLGRKQERAERSQTADAVQWPEERRPQEAPQQNRQQQNRKQQHQCCPSPAAVCSLTARTRDNQCALHGAGEQPGAISAPPQSSGEPSAIKHNKHSKRKRTPKDKAKSVATWPLAKQTLDNNMPNELRLGHFGDCEDLLSAHLAGRLYGGLKCHLLDKWAVKFRTSRATDSMVAPADVFAHDSAQLLLFGPFVQLQDELSATNYNHRRPFACPYEAPPTSWLQNALGLQSINPGSSATLKARLFASRGFRRRSYDDQEGDNDINIILQPSDLDDIEKQVRANYAQSRASLYKKTTTTTTTTTKTNNDIITTRIDGESTSDKDASVESKRLSQTEKNNGKPSTPLGATTTTTTNIFSQLYTNNRAVNVNVNVNNNKSKRQLLKVIPANIFHDIKLAKCLLDQDYNQTVRLFIKKSALNWNFNSFTFDALCCGRSLTELLLHLFDYYNLYNIFKLDIIKVLKCFRLLEFGYHSTNPYHNSVHAADVTQAMHCFIQENKIRRHMTNLEILCSILAAVCHDLDHPGVNQSFLVATNNPLASLYQNNSVLENHHWRFALCIFKESNIFEHFEQSILDNLKEQLKHLILATDIARQNEYLKRFRDLTSSHQFSMSNTDDRALVLQMALKCADLGNPCRPWLISRVWSNLICDEFYRMGQVERRLGVPLTPICQREKTSIAGIQADFFRFIVLPLLELWHAFLESPLSNLLMSNFDHNYKRWQRANRIVQQMRRRKSVACLEPVEDKSESCGTSAAAAATSCSELESPSHLIISNENNPTRASNFAPQILEPFFDPTMQTFCSKHSFVAIKRASSDYIKSGNGRLELLRDFQLNRIIEKSPLIARRSCTYDTCETGSKRRANCLTDQCEQQQASKALAAPAAAATCNQISTKKGCLVVAKTAQQQQPLRKVLSPIEDGGESGASPEVGRASKSSSGCAAQISRSAATDSAQQRPKENRQQKQQQQHFDELEDSSRSSTPASRASSACSSPVMRRSVSSRTSLAHEHHFQQQQKSLQHQAQHAKHHYEPSGGAKIKFPPPIGTSKFSISHPKALYSGKRRESDPGCPSDNYELAAAIVLLQYQNNTLFHKRRSSLPVCVPERRSSK